MSISSFAFGALGTQWQIDTPVRLEQSLVSRIEARVEAFDIAYSRFRSDSLVSTLAGRPGTYEFPDDARGLFRLYRELYDCTRGALTPLVGRVLEHLGYDAGYKFRRQPGTVTAPAWDDVLSVRETSVTTTQPVVLDVGAAGKGYLVDLVAGLLVDDGVLAFTVDASGDLIHRGDRPERVGLEDPFTRDRVIGVAEVRDSALCASAVHRRCWGSGLHHIVDPFSGEPVSAVIATWVVHPSCAVADGLATALFLAEPEDLAAYFDFAYVRVMADARLEYSAGFPGELFT